MRVSRLKAGTIAMADPNSGQISFLSTGQEAKDRQKIADNLLSAVRVLVGARHENDVAGRDGEWHYYSAG